MHMMHGYGSLWPMLFMIVFWAVLISLGIFLISNFVKGGKGKTPIEIINERLANGEIDEEEYKRLKSMIRQDCI